MLFTLLNVDQISKFYFKKSQRLASTDNNKKFWITIFILNLLNSKVCTTHNCTILFLIKIVTIKLMFVILFSQTFFLIFLSMVLHYYYISNKNNNFNKPLKFESDVFWKFFLYNIAFRRDRNVFIITNIFYLWILLII